MWVNLAMWVAQDEGMDLSVGDTWRTKLDLDMEDRREAQPSAVLGITLTGNPLTIEGPSYEIVGRVVVHPEIGRYLDAGDLKLAPQYYFSEPIGATLKIQSELRAGPGLVDYPSDPTMRIWEIKHIFIRQWPAVPDGEVNSFRPDRSSVRFRPTEKMQIWEDERTFDGSGITISDYLLEIA
jgi:hypothetical protein